MPRPKQTATENETESNQTGQDVENLVLSPHRDHSHLRLVPEKIQISEIIVTLSLCTRVFFKVKRKLDLRGIYIFTAGIMVHCCCWNNAALLQYMLVSELVQSLL